MANETQGQLTQLSIEPGPSLAAIPTPSVASEDVAPMVLASNELQTAQARLAAQPSPTIKQDGYAVVVKAPPAGGMLAYLVGPGAQIQLQGIDLNNSTVSQEGGNLRITTANGAEVLLLDYVNSAKDPSTVVVTDDGKLPAQQLLAALDADQIAQKIAEVEPAAGPGAAGSAGGGLLPPTILGTGVNSGEGIFSSVIGPFALPVPYDTIKTEEFLEGPADAPIVIGPDQLPPTARNDSFSTAVDRPITITFPQLLANDTDPENDPLTVVSVQGAENGTVSIVNGQVVFTPNPGFQGTGSFSYTITDGRGGTSTADVLIQIDPDPANQNNVIAADDADTVVAGRAVTVDVLRNDSDPEGDALVPGSVRLVSQPRLDDGSAAGGSVSIDPATGRITYTAAPGAPAGGFPYFVTFVYEVADDRGARDTATVTIEVLDPTVDANTVDAIDDTGSIQPAGATRTFNVTANDVDPQGDAFEIISIGQPRLANGTVAGTASFNAATGEVTYNSIRSSNGYTVSIEYTIRDARGAEDTATLTINVTPDGQNSVVAADDTADLMAGQEVRIDVLRNDTDPQGDTFSIVPGSVTQPRDINGNVRGQAILNADGTVTFRDTDGARNSGVVEFTYTIVDALGATDTAVVRVTIGTAANGVDANNDTLTVNQNAPEANITATILANDFDPQGDTFRITSVSALTTGQGTVRFDAATGQVFFTPANGYTGPVQFTYTITDSHGATDTALVYINVQPGTPPVDDTSVVAGNDNFSTPFNTNLTITSAQLLVNDYDPEGTTLNATNIISFTQPANGSLTRDASGNFIYNPNDTFRGTDTFTYTIRDAQGDEATATVVVRVDEPAPLDNPVDAVDDFMLVNPGQPRTINVLSNDSAPDGGLAFVRVIGNLPAGVVDLGGGRFSYTSPLDAPNGFEVRFQYEVRDIDGDTDTATVVFRVEDRPVDARDDVFSTREDTPINFTVAQLLANDSAPDGGLAFVRIVGSVPPGLSFNSTTGRFDYNPPANFNGSVSFQYEVRDFDGDTDIATVTINVDSVNDPVFANDDAFTTPEDTRLDFTVAQILANDSAPDGGLAFVRIVGALPTGLVFNSTTGQFTYNPPANWNGSVSFQYEVRDVDGDTDIATVTINVTPVNDPVFANDDAFSTIQRVPIDFTVAQLLANDSAPDGGLAFVRVVGNLPAGLTFNSATGQFNYNPPANVSGNVTFQYEVRDVDGDTDIATVTINVRPNSVTAVDDVVTMPKDVNSILINAIANDFDPQGDTFSITRIVSVSSGTASIENGQVRYNNPTREAGNATIVYEITDQYGATSQATIHVAIVADTNSVVAVDDNVNMARDVNSILINAIANDFDPEGDRFSITRIVSVSSGTASIENGQVRYTTPTRFSGTATIVYEITDQFGATDTATITVTIAADTNSVVAVDDSVTMARDVNSILINAIANDFDPQGDTFSITRIVSVSAGTATIENGQIRYNNPTRDAGTATIVYEITDQYGATDTATVTVKIEADSNSVVAVDDVVNMASNVNSILINAIANDFDPQGDAFSITRIVSVSAGTATIENGQIRYNNPTRDAGTATIVYEITDSKGATDTATVTVNIAADVNNVVAVDDHVTMARDVNSILVNAIANDFDPQGDSFSITRIVSVNGGGSANIENGQIRYNNGTRDAGNASIVYEITDSKGATSQATVYVNIEADSNNVVANNDWASVASMSSVNINVLANDYDPQGDSFGISRIVSGPNIGSVRIEGNGTITYVAGWTTAAYTTSFVYEIRDSRGAISHATVTVNVAAGQTWGGGGGNDGGGGGGGGGDCPLVIDLNGDGISIAMRSQSTAHFDLNGDGFAEWTSWVNGSDDAILAIDRNGNGQIDGIHEVFGGKGIDGFSELARLEDSNGDGVIDANDANWSNLRLWLDVNGDGISQDGELFTLDHFGIVAINLTSTGTSIQYGDAYIDRVGTVVKNDGSTLNAGSVFYTNDSNGQLKGTANDDVLIYSSAADSIDGGQGADTLKVLTASDIVISHDKVHSVEHIDLANNGADKLTLNINDVLGISDNGILTIDGDAVDEITLNGDLTRGDNVTQNGQSYASYVAANGGTVLVELGLTVHTPEQHH